MTLAVSALFDSKLLSKYNREIDKQLQDTEFPEIPGGELHRPRSTSKRSDDQKFRDAKRTVRELNKLNTLLAMG